MPADDVVATSVAPLLTAVVCLAVAAEGFVAKMEIAKVPAPINLAGLDRGAVMLDLPIVDDYSDTAAMLRATQTGSVLVNGFSGYTPPHYELMRQGLLTQDESVIEALRRYGPLLVFVHQDADADQRYLKYVDAIVGGHRVMATSAGTLFQFGAGPPMAANSDPSVPVAAVRASVNEAHAQEMHDGDLTTRWSTPLRQAPGDQVTITLDHDVTLSRLELDLGTFSDDFPRKLRVSVAGVGGAPVTVWEGRTTGVAMIAAMTDRQRMPLVFDLSRGVRGRELVLTVLDGHPELSWSIAELKVFGR